MTVKDLIMELAYYEGDSEVEFEFDDDVEVESWTENKYGDKEVEIRKMLEPSFICTISGNCRISLEVKKDDNRRSNRDTK